MPAKNELTTLRDEITSEVNRDAAILSEQLFAQRRPDVKYASNQEYDDIVYGKLVAGDREWLNNEALRDPGQFILSTQRLRAAGKVAIPGDPHAQSAMPPLAAPPQQQPPIQQQPVQLPMPAPMGPAAPLPMAGGIAMQPTAQGPYPVPPPGTL